MRDHTSQGAAIAVGIVLKRGGDDRIGLEADEQQILHNVFGYAAFRSAQQAIVEHVTGGGKSLCYQLPALLRPGVGVVVSPLIEN